MGLKRPIGIDLFCGAGGMSLGFEQAGFDIVAAIELDPVHAATHEFNFPLCKTICGNVKDISGKEIRSLAKIDRDIDVIFGGAPCQGFSMIGQRNLDDPRNSLVFHFIRLIKELKPKSFVFENVKGLTLGKHKSLLEEFISEINKLGYVVPKQYEVLNASSFGVPQERERLFILGVRKEFSVPLYPEPKSLSVKKHNKNRTLNFLNMIVGPTVQDAIADLPNIDNYEELIENDKIQLKTIPITDYQKKISGASVDKEDYSYSRKWDSNFLTSSMRTIHTEDCIARFKNTTGGTIERRSRLFKLSNIGVSNTLRAGTDSERGGHTSPRPLHPIYPRVISVREAARLHSYPDWFRFHVTKWHGFRQVGNSVPPLLARAVAESIRKSLTIKPSKPTQKIELGDEKLLKLNMTEASTYYGVSKNVIPQRIRKKILMKVR